MLMVLAVCCGAPVRDLPRGELLLHPAEPHDHVPQLLALHGPQRRPLRAWRSLHALHHGETLTHLASSAPAVSTEALNIAVKRLLASGRHMRLDMAS